MDRLRCTLGRVTGEPREGGCGGANAEENVLMRGIGTRDQVESRLADTQRGRN